MATLTEVRDANGNVATVKHFGSMRKAAASLKTLVNCYDCKDCVNCVKCRDCIRCEDCLLCKGCINCEESLKLDGADGSAKDAVAPAAFVVAADTDEDADVPPAFEMTDVNGDVVEAR